MCSHADLAALPPNCPLGHMSLRTSHPSCCKDHVPVRTEPPTSPLFGPQHTQAAACQCSHHNILLSLEVQRMETSSVAKCRGSTMGFFPVSRVELQKKKGLDILHHSATQVDLCPAYLHGNSPASKTPSHRKVSSVVPQTLPEGHFPWTGTYPLGSMETQ